MAKKRNPNAKKYIARRRRLMLFFVLIVVVFAFWVGTKMPQSFNSESGAESELPPSPLEADPSIFTLDEMPVRTDSSSSEPEPESEPEPVAPVIDVNVWNLILVNRRVPLPENFSVELETVIDSYAVDARIADPLKKMFAQAKADGISLVMNSAHRTIEYQQGLYNRSIQSHIANGKTEEQAIVLTEQYYAYPGCSEHHTGLAVDITTAVYQVLDDGFDKTPAFAWLSENARNYGFILRYPYDKVDITKINYEPWHYRYVGVEYANEIYASGLCLEEYLYVKGLELAGGEEAEGDEAEAETDDESGEAESGGNE